jgi:hypothetical protein
MSLRNSWAIAFLTGVGIFMTFVLRLNLSPVAPVLGERFHLTPFELGVLLSGFLYAYTILQPVAGWVTDRLGAKLSMLLGVAGTSILTILMGFANSFLTLFSLRVAMGVTQAPNFVSGAKVTSSEWFKKDERVQRKIMTNKVLAWAAKFMRRTPVFVRLPGEFLKIGLDKWGTIGTNVLSSECGDSPVKNWTGAGYRDFPISTHAEHLDPEKIIAYQKKKYNQN